MAQKNSGKIPVPNINYNILRTSAVLLCMEYKPSELARELRINPKTILRSYIPAGLPHRRDEGGNIWIVGTKFNKWARTIYEHTHIKAGHILMKDNQVFCVRCNCVVEFHEIKKSRALSGGRSMLFVVCPNCGKTCVRFMKGISHDRETKLQTDNGVPGLSPPRHAE
jgi:hypothetical protein